MDRKVRARSPWSLREKSLATAAFLAVAYVVVRLWLSFRPHESLVAASNRVFREVRSGRGEVLWSDVLPAEAEVLGLDEAKFRSMMTWYYQCLAGYRPEGPRVDQLGPGDMFMVSDQWMLSTSGDRLKLTLEFYRTPDGVKIHIPSLFTSALQARYAKHHQDASPGRRYWLSLADGIPKERHNLDMWSRGVDDVGAKGLKLIPWDSLQRDAYRLATVVIPRREAEQARKRAAGR